MLYYLALRQAQAGCRIVLEEGVEVETCLLLVLDQGTGFHAVGHLNCFLALKDLEWEFVDFPWLTDLFAALRADLELDLSAVVLSAGVRDLYYCLVYPLGLRQSSDLGHLPVVWHGR